MSASTERVLVVSRVVWDHVVSRGWLDGARASTEGKKVVRPNDPDYGICRGVDLFRAAAAMFPLVVLACKRVLGGSDGYAAAVAGSYDAITSAASVPAPACVAWIINNRRRPGIGTGGGSLWERPITTEKGKGRCSETIDLTAAVKEVTAALMGLCVGGHLNEAQSVLGRFPSLWDGKIIPAWTRVAFAGCVEGGDTIKGEHLIPNNTVVGAELVRERVIENVRGASGSDPFFLARVCDSGHVDVVKWLVSLAGITRDEAPWALNDPLCWSITRGKLEVFKSLFNWCVDGSNLTEELVLDLCYRCARSVCPENIKWCMENLPARPNMEFITCELLRNKHSTLEACRWLEDEIHQNGVNPFFCTSHIHKADIAKWLLTVSPSLLPVEEALNSVCHRTGDVEFLQWLVNEKGFAPTAQTFTAACGSLSEADISFSLEEALQRGNMEVVAWLEEEFHDVVDALNSNQQAAEDLFVGLCMRHGDRKGKDVGLKWFLQHVSDSKITMSCISNAVGCLMRTGCWKYVPLVLDHFTQFEPQAFPRELEEIVMNLLRTFDMKAFQVLSGGGASSSSFTPEFVAKCLTSDLFQPESSKAVKWAISKFHLQYPHIKSNHHHLLFNLLLHGKNQCAHWLLTTFDIPLSDLVTEIKPHRWSLALAGWHMILDHYGPAIDAAVIRNHFMPLLSRDPLLGTHTMRTFGIALDEFRTCVMANPHKGLLSLEARTWLGLPSSC